jgi:hypothetical protein
VSIITASRHDVLFSDKEVLSRLLDRLWPTFQGAYQTWRDQLCDDDAQGIPWAQASGDYLFQIFEEMVLAEPSCLNRPEKWFSHRPRSNKVSNGRAQDGIRSVGVQLL